MINYENNYINGEKNLNEIIEIQLYLKTSSYHLAASKFHMAKIKYFNKSYDEAQKYALDAKNLFQNYNKNKKEGIIIILIAKIRINKKRILLNKK